MSVFITVEIYLCCLSFTERISEAQVDSGSAAVGRPGKRAESEEAGNSENISDCGLSPKPSALPAGSQRGPRTSAGRTAEQHREEVA